MILKSFSSSVAKFLNDRVARLAFYYITLHSITDLHNYCNCIHVYTGLFKSISLQLLFYNVYNRCIQYLDNRRLLVDTCVYGCRVPRDGRCSTRSWLCTSIHSMFWNLYLGNG